MEFNHIDRMFDMQTDRMIYDLGNVKAVNLGHVKINAEDAARIATFLSDNGQLEELYLGHSIIGFNSDSTNLILRSLHNNTNLKTLRIGGASDLNPGFSEIAKLLYANKSITKLCLIGKFVDDTFDPKNYPEVYPKGADDFYEALKINTTLEVLTIHSPNDDSIVVDIICQSLANNNSIHTLNLCCNVDSYGATSIGRLLNKNTQLCELNLNRCKIDSEGTQQIARGLKNNSKLQSLNLDGNSIGMFGVLELTDVLDTNKSLTELNLGNSLISDECASEILESLFVNNTLRKLKIWFYREWRSTFGKLIRLFESERLSLHELDIKDTRFSVQELLEIIGLLGKNTSLRTFKWHTYIISREAEQAAIFDLLKDNYTLQHFDIGCRIQYEPLVKHLEENKKNADANRFRKTKPASI